MENLEAKELSASDLNRSKGGIKVDVIIKIGRSIINGYKRKWYNLIKKPF